LLLLGGMTTLLPRVEDVEAVLQRFASLDTTSLATFNSAITQFQQGKLTETALVRTLEQDVLQPWRTQRDAVLRLQNLPQLPRRQKRVVAAVVEYMTARQEGWELLQEGLQKDDARALKRAQEKQHQADKVFEQFGTAPR
jgi:hypothetical protein